MEIGMGRLFNHGSSIQNIFCDCILCIEYWYFPHKTSIILSITTPENINCVIMDFIGKNICVFFIIISSKSITFIPHLAYYLFLAWVGMGELFNHNHSPQPGPSAHLLYIVSLVIYAKYQICFHICPLFHILLRIQALKAGARILSFSLSVFNISFDICKCYFCIQAFSLFNYSFYIFVTFVSRSQQCLDSSRGCFLRFLLPPRLHQSTCIKQWEKFENEIQKYQTNSRFAKVFWL